MLSSKIMSDIDNQVAKKKQKIKDDQSAAVKFVILMLNYP